MHINYENALIPRCLCFRGPKTARFCKQFQLFQLPTQTTEVPLNRAFLDELTKQHPLLGCHSQKKTHRLRGQSALVSSGFTYSWLDPTLAFSLKCNHLLKLLTNLTVDVMWSYITLDPKKGYCNAMRLHGEARDTESCHTSTLFVTCPRQALSSFEH